MSNYRFIKSSHFFSLLFAFCILFSSSSLFGQSKNWVGTWACAVYPLGSNNTTFPPAVANNSVRQIVRVSIGGDSLRIRFSNKTATTTTTIKSVSIAVSKTGTTSVINTSTVKQLKFNGDTTVTMAAGGLVTSDAVAFHLTPSMRLAITIHYGAVNTDANMAAHVAARGPAWELAGNHTHTSAIDSLFTGSTSFTNWLNISNIDVLADTAHTHAVACIGNSITDGRNMTGGLQNRWPDMFSVNMLKYPSTANVGVLNLGIGGTNVSGSGTAGAARYAQDVLSQSGLKWVIIFYGVNDINGGATASAITTTYQSMISQAHAKNLKVYGGTITPFGGNSYFSTAHEGVRNAVNKWIRTKGNFDGFIDFDHAVRNPADSTKILAAYNDDGLHLSAAGYKVMGECIPLSLFADPTISELNSIGANIDYDLIQNSPNPFSNKTTIEFKIPNETYVSLQVYNMLGAKVIELAGKKYPSGKNTVEFDAKNLQNGIYICTMKADNYSTSRKMILLGK